MHCIILTAKTVVLWVAVEQQVENLKLNTESNRQQVKVENLKLNIESNCQQAKCEGVGKVNTNLFKQTHIHV